MHRCFWRHWGGNETKPTLPIITVSDLTETSATIQAKSTDASGIANYEIKVGEKLIQVKMDYKLSPVLKPQQLIPLKLSQSIMLAFVLTVQARLLALQVAQ